MNELLPLQAANSDGTSQEQRSLVALQTDYVAIDERSLKDQLVLAYAFAKQLKYFDFDNSEAGDWQSLIYPDAELDFATWLQQIEDFIKQPDNYTDASYYNLHRPHFVLFLTFLQLLKNTQGQLNQLTARHLEFYYRKVLKFTLKPPQPDRVNILVSPSTQVNSTLLPAGTLLAAGKDSLGKDLVYRTDTDLVVNHANIAGLSSVYVNKQVIGIREARELNTGTTEDKVLAMLKMALGDPAPSDDLPKYPFNKEIQAKVDFSYGLLTKLQTLFKFVGKDGLFMELGELRSLIKLKNNRGPAADNDWQTINKNLTKAGKNRTDSNFTLKNSDASSRNFDENLKDALGVSSLTDYFKTLPLVKNITELYQQEPRDENKAFIIKKLYLDIDSFNEMMQLKIRIDNEWKEIYTILKRAGARKLANYQFDTPTEPPDFEKIFQAFISALAIPAYPNAANDVKITDLDSFYAALLDIEDYFYMPLEDFGILIDTVNLNGVSNDLASNNNDSNPMWLKVYEQLAVAHWKKGSADRKAQLKSLCTPKPITTVNQKSAVQGMMQLALGVSSTDTAGLANRIKELLPAGADLSLLEKANTGNIFNDEEWDSVCNKLEIAWRNRVPIPVAQTSNWISISACNDTLSAKVPGISDAGRWYTFGQRQAQLLTNKNNPPTTAMLGWAISSPLLCLAQGPRSVTLTLGFKSDQFNTDKISALPSRIFRLELSTAKGWITVDSIGVTKSDFQGNTTLKSLSWTLNLDESSPAISALPDTDSSGIKASWPLLRLLLQPRWDDKSKTYVTDYSLFQGLLLEKVLLAVDVKKLTECKLQNDDQTLPAGKPFEPFGSAPAIGARLYFAHPELILKKLEKLEITLQWMGVPSDLKAYYQNYSTIIPDENNKGQYKTVKITQDLFTNKLILVDQRMELSLDESSKLFNHLEPAMLAIDNVATKIPTGYRYERQLTVSNEENVTAWPRYWFLELSGCDFQHAAYPAVAAAKAIELATEIANNANAANDKKVTIDPNDYKVNPPYTPKLKNFSINYTASIELNVADLQSLDADQVYHLHPFGYAPILFDQQVGGYRFLPAYDNEGELYIGLSGVQAPQTLSMLLQMAEGTANPDLKAADVQWSVLNGNYWQKLDQGQLQQDTTNGLLQSGIVKLQLAAVTSSTLLPADWYWLRVAIDSGCDSVCDSIGIFPQAVTATFIDQDNAESHLYQPLPANTITSLVDPDAAIASIKQPFTSFGAKPKEQVSRFNTRISERLRHKQRAVTHWDYERLVLEQFPEIYKVKCIPAGLQENQGEVTVVVIPDARNRSPFNPFEPKASAGLLDNIEIYLSAYAPFGALIKVKNASYHQVKVRFAVSFQPGSDSGFYIKQLNEDVNRFLSPWAYEQGKDIIIGGKIYANAIIDFIERRAYVDFVEHFKLFLADKNGDNFTFITPPDLNDKAEGYAVTANSPDAVLVAATTHEIDLITEINYGEQIFKGINYMKLELDFIVG